MFPIADVIAHLREIVVARQALYSANMLRAKSEINETSEGNFTWQFIRGIPSTYSSLTQANDVGTARFFEALLLAWQQFLCMKIAIHALKTRKISWIMTKIKIAEFGVMVPYDIIMDIIIDNTYKYDLNFAASKDDRIVVQYVLNIKFPPYQPLKKPRGFICVKFYKWCHLNYCL